MQLLVLEILDGLDRELGVEALAGPRHVEQHPGAFLGELLGEILLLEILQQPCRGVVGGDERHALEDVHRILVAVDADADLADREDRKSVVEGKSVSGGVDPGGGRRIKKKKKK